MRLTLFASIFGKPNSDAQTWTTSRRLFCSSRKPLRGPARPAHRPGNVADVDNPALADRTGEEARATLDALLIEILERGGTL
jgi:hypothetical protein